MSLQQATMVSVAPHQHHVPAGGAGSGGAAAAHHRQGVGLLAVLLISGLCQHAHPAGWGSLAGAGEKRASPRRQGQHLPQGLKHALSMTIHANCRPLQAVQRLWAAPCECKGHAAVAPCKRQRGASDRRIWQSQTRSRTPDARQTSKSSSARLGRPGSSPIANSLSQHFGGRQA